jgi:hypothetical protein
MATKLDVLYSCFFGVVINTGAEERKYVAIAGDVYFLSFLPVAIERGKECVNRVVENQTTNMVQILEKQKSS